MGLSEAGPQRTLNHRVGAGDLTLQQRKPGNILGFVGVVVAPAAPLGQLVEEDGVGILANGDSRESDLVGAGRLDELLVGVEVIGKRAPIGEQHGVADVDGLLRQSGQAHSENPLNVGAAATGQVRDLRLDLGHAQPTADLLEGHDPEGIGVKGQNTDAVIGLEAISGELGSLFGHRKLTYAEGCGHTGRAVDDQQQGNVAALRAWRRLHLHRQHILQGGTLVGTEREGVPAPERHQSTALAAHKLTHAGHLVERKRGGWHINQHHPVVGC